MRLGVFIAVVASLLASLAIPASGRMISPALADGALGVTTRDTSYGTVLFTTGGRALYVLSFDTRGSGASPAKSSCSGPCLGAWPPLLAPTPTGPFDVSGGVHPSGLSTIQRSDGSFQVTYFGRPLYMFVRDTAPGDTHGENVAAFQGIWDLVSTDGRTNAGVATVSAESTAQGTALSAATAFSTFRSLYNLTSDPPKISTCDGGCAQFWPPLLTTAPPIAGTGVDPSMLGTIRRSDGTVQVTYHGVPLYMYTFDLAAGAKSGLTNGQDNIDPFNQGVWYLMSPSGAALPAQATLDTTSTSLGTALSFDTATVYAFTADTPSSSACSGLCARIWTPVLTTGAAQVASSSGLAASSLGTIQRADGTTQVTYAGHPLYLFGPSFSGTKGQGSSAFGGTFGVMLASGAASTAPPTVVAVPQLTATPYGTSAAFMVDFSSAVSGQGKVLFGSGPGCGGLLGTATQDTGAGTANHAVRVSGNELSNSGGDNAIQPGAKYWYEVTNTTSAGTTVDDNGGKCYSVIIPPA